MGIYTKLLLDRVKVAVEVKFDLDYSESDESFVMQLPHLLFLKRNDLIKKSTKTLTLN